MNRRLSDQHARPDRNRQRPVRERPPESKAGVALLCSIFLIFGGCTTTQTVDPRSPEPTEVDLKPGEAVAISLSDGRELDLSIVEWTNERLVGRDRADATHIIARQDIARLEVTRFSPRKTMSLVVAIAVVALAHAIVDGYAELWAPPPAIY